MNFLHYMKGLVLLFFIAIVGIVAFPIMLEIIGYHVFETGGNLAEKLVFQGKPVRECLNKMEVPWNFLGPPASEHRKTCIHEYARLKQDPTACELLLPSSYGWSCVGAASRHDPCVVLGDSRTTVKGNNMITTFEECLTGPNEIRNNECCQIARIQYESGNTETCDGITKTEALADQCHTVMAARDNDIHICQLVEDVTTRAACELYVKY